MYSVQCIVTNYSFYRLHPLCVKLKREKSWCLFHEAKSQDLFLFVSWISTHWALDEDIRNVLQMISFLRRLPKSKWPRDTKSRDPDEQEKNNEAKFFDFANILRRSCVRKNVDYVISISWRYSQTSQVHVVHTDKMLA